MASLPCRAIEGGWTLGSLVGAYLDLALAYLCLCAAAVAFLADKFLALFGIPLPCSCGGQVSGGHIHHHYDCQRSGSVCLQALLLDYPTAKIAGVHMSLRRRFSFDTLCHDCRRMLHAGCCFCSDGCGSYDVNLVNDEDNREDEGGCGNGEVGRTRSLSAVGDEAESCGSVSKPTRDSGCMLSLSRIVNGEEASELETSFRQGGNPVDVKGKGILSTNPQSALQHRRRRRNSLIAKTKSPRVPASTPLQLGWEGDGARPISINVRGQSQQVSCKRRSAPAGHQMSGDHDEWVGRATSAIKYDSDNKDSCEEIASGSEINEWSIIRDLKQALEEEKSAHAALLLELEKERNWEATAADEAMAMILRLQEEKAAIEMEARQYKRMTEEKSAYDEEELDILKEIIVRRERETHVLEKEIESYREMMLNDNGVSGSNAKHEVHQITEENNLFSSSDEAELILKEIYRSIKKKADDRMQCLDDCEPSVPKETNLTSSSVSRLLSFDKIEERIYLNHDSVRLSPSFEKNHQTTSNPREECIVEEKDMLTFEDCASSLQNQRSAKEFHWCRDEPDPLEDSCTNHDPNTDKINSEAFTDNEVSVVDVHVIDDITDLNGQQQQQQSLIPLGGVGTDLNGQGKENDISLFPVGCASDTPYEYNMIQQPFLPAIVDHSTLEKLKMHRSCSDSIMGLSANRSYPRSSWSDLRRSSVTSVDSERLKLENEVETLRKRLKIVQEGREKLSNSLEQREKEMYHLQVLEEIACQLQEIRKVTETEKSIRRASLPPSSSMVTLKRRRCQSVSTEQQERT